MRVIAINSGSSSIKYEVFALDDCSTLVVGLLERIGTRDARFNRRWLTDSGGWTEATETLPVADHYEAFQFLLDVVLRYPTARVAPDTFFGFGHRVVHGGEVFREPVIVDDEVVRGIKALIPLAPLHNPYNVLAIEALRGLRPDVPNVAVFDTAFHGSIPPKAFHYALPEEMYHRHHVRRYGFHGTSHQFVTGEASRYLDVPKERLNLISFHLGNGASATAVQGGKSFDTSMGLTPLEGLIMGTRCGDLDPAVPFYLTRKTGKPFEAIEDILNRESGLKGVCGTNDMREIERRAAEGDACAELAVEMFCYRIRKYIGAYFAVLGRVDALIFTGGIGENSARVRKKSCDGLTALGISMDERRNGLTAVDISVNDRRNGLTALGISVDDRRSGEPASGVMEIQDENSRVKILVIRTHEELEIARQTIQTIRTISRIRA